ncbi:MAG: NAD-dependent epimerase/dehydratase family protein [Thermoflavifilum sp.]|nr:NAD-dependent epimerase/dehydratase family protein [Thermoflavifilum sp.]
MSILVTGGSGLLGSHLIAYLVKQHQPVRAIYRTHIPVLPEEVQKQVEWVRADLLDILSLREALTDIQQVYHCAGKVSFARKARHELMQVNVEGTRHLVDLCIDRQVKRLVHVSSVAALGRAEGEQHIDDDHQPEQVRRSGYGWSKYLGEMEAWRGWAEGLEVVIVQPTIILGPAHWHTGSPALFKKIYEGFPFYTTGVNGFVDVRDVARAMYLLMQSPVNGERFILNGDNWSYQRLFATIAACFQRPAPRYAASRWMGYVVAAYQQMRSWFSAQYEPVVTRETIATSQLKVYYHPTKFLRFFPDFRFTPLEETIAYTCAAFLSSRHEPMHAVLTGV